MAAIGDFKSCAMASVILRLYSKISYLRFCTLNTIVAGINEKKIAITSIKMTAALIFALYTVANGMYSKGVCL